MQAAGNRLSSAAALLDSLSPLKVLERGYSLAFREGRTATAAALSPGDEVSLRFHDGRAEAVITAVEAEDRLPNTGKDGCGHE